MGGHVLGNVENSSPFHLSLGISCIMCNLSLGFDMKTMQNKCYEFKYYISASIVYVGCAFRGGASVILELFVLPIITS